MVAQKQLRLHTYWQVIHALATDPAKRSHQIAEVLGLSAANVTRIIQLYNTKGADFDQGLQWGGRRLTNSFMSLDQQAAMMKQLQAKALKVAVLTFHDIKEAVEKKLSGQVSDDYIRDLFKRHGWSKKALRPKHPNQGWHTSGALELPENMELLLLPPYSPELNPTEHIWDYIREQKEFNNHVFSSLDRVEDQLAKALKQIHKEKQVIKSICNFNWISSYSC